MGWSDYKQEFEPYKGIFRFFVVMFLANFLWKMAISSDENAQMLLLFHRWDVTFLFRPMLDATCAGMNWILRDVLGMHFSYDPEWHLISFGGPLTVRVAWECSGLKQLFVFTMIMLFASGRWKDKLWFIPLGWILCALLNVLRLVLLSAILYSYPFLFNLFHLYILKYGFYLVIFFYWVWWDECFSKK